MSKNVKQQQEDELFAAAVEKFGAALQIAKACEELAELQQALMKWVGWRIWLEKKEPDENDERYGKALIDNIREELCDVCIMCMQLEQIFGHDARMMERKVAHLRELVEMEK